MTARKSHAILLALPLALCACSSASERFTELIAPPPQNYREIVTTRARTVYNARDIRETAISAPFNGRSILGASSLVCVRTNAINEKTGTYTDRKVTSFTFRNGEIVEVDSRFAPAICMNAVYEPFPELEQEYTPPPPVAAPRAKRTKPSSASR